MSDSHTTLARLKRRIERPRASASLFALGAERLDARLGGGLARGALHELVATGAGDHAAVSGFALMLAARAAGERPILWVREDKGERRYGRLYAPGVMELGIDPDALVPIVAPDTLAALRAAADTLVVRDVGAVVIEPFGAATALDLTASRRLVLAAEKSGACALVIRDGESRFASAAATRWLVAAAPSVPLPGNAPGRPALDLSLLRHRGGVAPFEMRLEWDRDQLSLAEPVLLRPVLPVPQRGSLAA